MELELEESGKTLVTLSGNELFRLGRGDVVEYGDYVLSSRGMKVKCSTPESTELLADMKNTLRAVERENAILRLHRDVWSWQVHGVIRGRNDAIAVIIPTVGDSVVRIANIISGMRMATCEPHIIIADDGGFEPDKQAVANLAECSYVKNSGPHGIPGNLNSAIRHTASEWVMIIDDGSIPHRDFMVAAMKAVTDVSGRTFGGRRVGMIGFSHIQDWMLRVAGAITKWSVQDWFYKNPDLVDSMARYFRATFKCPHRVTWPGLRDNWSGPNVPADVIEEWPTEADMLIAFNTVPLVRSELVDDIELEVNYSKYWWTSRWPDPKSRWLRVNWSPGAQGLLVNREFLDQCGGFGYDCVAYERLLACRAAEMGWLSLFCDGPPYLHVPSLGFNEITEETKPVHRDLYEVCEERWSEREPNRVIRRFSSRSQDDVANSELAQCGLGGS